jgi:uncharacterized pyridoxamine 5'-phosphate oxidase family protein
MNAKDIFYEIMENADTIALASSVDNIPNVRILNFVYIAGKKILYFTSIKGDPKESEFEKNQNVAFVTIPKMKPSCVRVQFSKVKKSIRTIYDVQDLFIEKWAWYKGLIETHGKKMDIYEVHFTTAIVFPEPDCGYLIQL